VSRDPRRLDRRERAREQLIDAVAHRVPQPRRELLELLDRAMDQHLRRAIGSAEGARDLAVVHA